ncbi:MAG: pseudouridine synthase [Candidatus Falkowbacteria bacterium]
MLFDFNILLFVFNAIEKMKIVLQKFIADSGLCSRRNAEELIRLKKVMVNKKPAELGMKVDENDEIKINSKKIELEKHKIYIKLNKPAGYICTNKKFKGEKNVFDLINLKERLFVVGRLDKDSRGLVLLTNDGELTQKLTHPKFEHEKKYIVTVGTRRCLVPTDDIIKKFKKGVDIGDDDGIVKAKKIKYLSTQGGQGNSKFEIILAQGKKRQIRRMFKKVGYDVEDLDRIKIGSLKLGNLAEGEWEYLGEEEIKNLKK